MNPDNKVYEKIYENLGDGFLAHLKAGDLNLYQTNKAGELVKKSCAGRVWIHLPGSLSSIDVAKEILADKFIKALKSADSLNAGNRIFSSQGHSLLTNPSDLSGLEKITILFEIVKIAASKGEVDEQFLTNCGIKDMNKAQRFEIAKLSIENGGIAVSEHLDNFYLTEKQRFELAAIAAKKNKENPLVNSESDVYQYFSFFEIADPALNFQLLKILALEGYSISKCVREHSFFFTQKQCFELAMLASLRRGNEVLRDIEDYNLTEYQLVEVVNAVAAKGFNQDQAATSIAFSLENIKNLISLLRVYKDYVGLVAISQFPGLGLLLGVRRELTNDELKEYAEASPLYEGVTFVLEKIYSQKDEHIRRELMGCLGIFLLVCQIQNISPGNLKSARPLIEELFDFRDPSFRLNLMPNVVETIKTEEGINSWRNLFNLTENKSFTALISMLLAPNVSEGDKRSVADIVKYRATFQNTTLRNPFIKNLSQIVNETSYSAADSQAVLKNLVLEPPMTPLSFLQNAERVACLLRFGKADAIKTARSLQGLDVVVDSILNEKLRLHSIEHSAEKFVNTFGSFPEPTLLFRYAANLMKLQGNEREAHMDCLRDFVVSVLEGDFHEVRYETDKNVHLQTIFSGGEGERLKSEWMKGARFEDAFSPSMVLRNKEKVFDPVDFFLAKIIQEGYLPQSDFEELCTVLQEPHKKDEIKEKLTLLLSSGKASSREEIQKRKIYSFQLQAIKLLYPETPLSKLEIEEKVKNLLKVIRDIYKNNLPPFYQDLLEVVSSFQGPQIKRQPGRYEGYVVTDTDDPYRLLNLGKGSCQSVDCDIEYSKSLLSYILDGKNRAIIVEDSEGNVVARAVIRLLWDAANDRIVMFQERIYPTIPSDSAIERAIINACKQRAGDLNVPLLSAKPSDIPYRNEVGSIGGRTPSEYADGGPGRTGNVWSVRRAYRVL